MIQGGEIIIILLVALVVLGPTRLPDMARRIGQWTAELRAAAREITQGLEAEVADLKQVGKDLKAPVEELKQPLKDVQGDVKAADPRRFDWTGPKPVSGPTPEDAMADLEEINEADEADEEAE